jgi:hypothetical protein
MGADFKVGPYMVVKGKVNIERTEDVVTCSNKKCKVHKDKVYFDDEEIKFCSICGSKIETQNLTWSDIIGPDDIFYEDDLVKDVKYSSEKISNRIWLVDSYEDKKGIAVFTTEKKMPFETKERRDTENYEVIDLTNVNKEEEMKWFKETYKSEIQIFEKIFGEDSVSFHWGVLQY